MSENPTDLPEWLTVGATVVELGGTAVETAHDMIVTKITKTQVVATSPTGSAETRYRRDGLREIGSSRWGSGRLVSPQDPTVTRIRARERLVNVAYDVEEAALRMRRAKTDAAARDAARKALGALTAFLEG